mmetsp:Transcript_14192/g.24122  ORF Transcript_14192/g.24122 Transcript_14192/m.24122 type:complete len:238 (-) Transcript_14192:837-1550(-)
MQTDASEIRGGFRPQRQTIYSALSFSQNSQQAVLTDQSANWNHVKGMKMTQASIISHAPSVFQEIRLLDQINEQEMISSLDPERNRQQIFKANQGHKHSSGGKSGSFFFFTEDRKFIIKTIGKQEMQKYLSMLPRMLHYFKRNGCESYIQRIYGLYTIKLAGLWKFNVMVQGNAFKTSDNGRITYSFDLKGSTFQRQVIPESIFAPPTDNAQVQAKKASKKSQASARSSESFAPDLQ